MSLESLEGRRSRCSAVCEQQGALHCFPLLEEIHYREDHPAMDAGWHSARLTSRARAALLALMLVDKSLTVSGRWNGQSAGGTGGLGRGTGGLGGETGGLGSGTGSLQVGQEV